MSEDDQETIDAFEAAKESLWALYTFLEKMHVVSGTYTEMYGKGGTTVAQDEDFVMRFLK